MKKGINVLSLFDGMSCGQIALGRLGIKVDKYFASEIDKYAIKVAQNNYPDTIQLGDVRGIKAESLPNIDLLIGGSPCQGFSFAGKQLNFNDPRSALFFEYVRLLREVKPKYFLLENVNMRKDIKDAISKEIGCEPIRINSKLLSAQKRDRLYWTNIPDIIQPIDKGINLSEIIEDGFVDQVKSYCIDANYFKGGNLKSYFDKSRRQLVFGARKVGRRIKNGKRCDYDKSVPIKQIIEINQEPNKSNCLTTVQKDNLLVFNKDEVFYRKLTPLECERLQTVPEGYTKYVSNTQRYKMLGNGWTVDVICHILRNMEF